MKLKRIFNVFNPVIWKEICILFGSCTILLTILYLIGVSDDDHSLLQLILFLIAIFPIELMFLVLVAPSKLLYDKDSVRFTLLQNVFVYGNIRYVFVHYDVVGLKNVQFSQNKIEKIFGVGHITFSGVVDYEARRYADRIKPKSNFSIYGIPEFSSFIEEFPHKNK